MAIRDPVATDYIVYAFKKYAPWTGEIFKAFAQIRDMGIVDKIMSDQIPIQDLSKLGKIPKTGNEHLQPLGFDQIILIVVFTVVSLIFALLVFVCEMFYFTL